MRRTADYESGRPYAPRAMDIEAAKFLQSVARRYVEGRTGRDEVERAIAMWKAATEASAVTP